MANDDDGRETPVTDTEPPPGACFRLHTGGQTVYAIGGIHRSGGRECWRWDPAAGAWLERLERLDGWSHVYVVPDPSRGLVPGRRAPDRGRFPHRCRCGSAAYFGAVPAAYECSNSACPHPAMADR